MRTATGLERLLISETNVSDLLQLLAMEDPSPLRDLLTVNFDQVRRESGIGSQNRADLLLLRAGQPVAAIEVKLGHSFSDDQRIAYEAWAAEHGSPSLGIASLDAPPANLPKTWSHHPLPALFSAWSESKRSFVSELAERVVAVLEGWARAIEGVRRRPGAAGSLVYADVDNVALMRVIARDLQDVQRAQGRECCAGVSSGGGNPLVQSWTRVQGVDGVHFIADARFEDHRVHLRFGIDGEAETEKEVWRVAQILDEAITVSAFNEFLARKTGGPGPLPKFEKVGRGRPAAKGDWNSVIASGNSAKGANPGFLRDGLRRLECGARLHTTELNSFTLGRLMDAVHDHLKEAWAATAPAVLNADPRRA